MAHSKILYVEDDPGSQTLVSRVLAAEGYTVVTADNGLDGIRVAQEEAPDLILMDINMSGLSGLEVTTRLRSMHALDKTPIIALTANTLRGSRERALVAGCDGYLTKPVDIDELPRQVASFLQGYREAVAPDKKADFLQEYNQQVVEHLENKVRELEESHRALQKLEQLKSNFIILSAHELRTPITLVFGYARLLLTQHQMQNNGNSGNAFMIEKIFDATSRLNDLVNDILNVALIQADEMKLDFDTVSLEKVINAALVELNPLEQGRDLAINIEPLADLPLIDGNEDRLHQVFYNLLSNAVKYTPDGGEISVRGWIEDDQVHLLVKDNGIGIAPDNQTDIFDSFYIAGDIAHHSTSKIDFMGGGMGIGLSIVHGIVKAHNGRVWVQSSGVKGEGACFHVQLPRQQRRLNHQSQVSMA